MFPLTFDFHDSEVKYIRQEQHIVRVVFSAARVHSTDATPERFDGFALGLELQLIGVIGAAASPNCFGRLSHGSLSVGAPARSSLVLPCLPFEWAGQTRLVMEFSQGDTWAASGLRVRFDWTDGERFQEAAAC